MEKPVLYLIIPCYNEESVIPLTSSLFLKKLTELIKKEKVHKDSKILFINDGSIDGTWSIIRELALHNHAFKGISLSRNRGHQNAVLAGLMEVKNLCDIALSIDCDGQDDINAMEDMVDAYLNGCDIVYGVRIRRDTDTFFKRFTAEKFYKLLHRLGAEVVFNHADYRLVSRRILDELADFREVNLFLRGLFPLIGFKSACVYYERKERLAGETKYPLKQTLALAADGITSLSIKPLRMILWIGTTLSGCSILFILWFFTSFLMRQTADSWIILAGIICFIGGLQLICLGIIGEYIGKIYLEVKARPRYIISERT